MKGLEDVHIVEIKTVEDIKPPLADNIAAFLKGIMDGARSSFEKDHECHPFFFMMKDEKMGVAYISEISDENKSAMFRMMHQKVQENDACILINEVWMARALKSEAESIKKCGHGLLVMPRDRIDRREMVMLNLWMKDRQIGLTAEITRKPDQLGSWQKFNDTADTDSPKAEGRMLGKEIE